jgi:hypothetical protein
MVTCGQEASACVHVAGFINTGRERQQPVVWGQAVLKGRGLSGVHPSKPVEVAKGVCHSLTYLGGQGRGSLVDRPWFGCRWWFLVEWVSGRFEGTGTIEVYPSKPVGVAEDVSHSLTCLGGQGRVSSVDLPWFWNRRSNT